MQPKVEEHHLARDDLPLCCDLCRPLACRRGLPRSDTWSSSSPSREPPEFAAISLNVWSLAAGLGMLSNVGWRTLLLFPVLQVCAAVLTV